MLPVSTCTIEQQGTLTAVVVTPGTLFGTSAGGLKAREEFGNLMILSSPSGSNRFLCQNDDGKPEIKTTGKMIQIGCACCTEDSEWKDILSFIEEVAGKHQNVKWIYVCCWKEAPEEVRSRVQHLGLELADEEEVAEFVKHHFMFVDIDVITASV